VKRSVPTRISDFADLYDVCTAAHNPASPVSTIASAHAASAMRNFRIHELAKWLTGGRRWSCTRGRSGKMATA
jgi:L-alanine-DL-glutamate epimerase-like enolase superfamily enzyme